MKIFVVNCGSSSIKYQLFSMAKETVLARGVVERVGTNEALLKFEAPETSSKAEHKIDAPDHTAAMGHILDALQDSRYGVLSNIDEIEAIGHRVVHGGEKFSKPELIDDNVIELIKDNFDLAPLHNPANLMGIDAAMKALPGKPNVAVFDTAFLSTLPAKAYRYGVPKQWYTDHHVRKYGFHGTSHKFVTHQTALQLGKSLDELNIITAHLGNGCSITAVKNGKAVDHSMGMTPLEGVMMGTRSGDLDPAVIPYIINKEKIDASEVDTILNKKSGLMGVSCYSNDMRDLLGEVERGNADAELAVEMFVYRIVKYIGQYFTVLPDCDGVVFTGGIGENSVKIREKITQGLTSLGAAFDEKRNTETVGGQKGPITANGSKLPVWVIPTNEELMIARDTRRVIADGRLK